MKLGDKMREIRLKNNLTQVQLANKMQVTQSYISLVELNLTTPRAMYIELFCFVFQIDKSRLLEEVRKCG